MPRFISWLAIAVASAFLVVATAAFSLPAIAALAFALSVGTLLVSSAIADYGGVFAAGAVRSGSTKRCATAVGEGAMAVQLVHARLAERQQVQRIAAT